jgi:hypothetical protein
MWLAVAGRAIAVIVFWGHGGPWRNVSIFEGVMGGLLGAALVLEGWRTGSEEKGKSSWVLAASVIEIFLLISSHSSEFWYLPLVWSKIHLASGVVNDCMVALL